MVSSSCTCRRMAGLDLLWAARSLACEGLTGWAREVSIHVYEGRYALGGRAETQRVRRRWEFAKVREKK